MAEFVLITSDDPALKELVEKALGRSDVKAVVSNELLLAKRKLVQAIPCVIVSEESFGGDSEAGYKLARDLKTHAEYSKIPLILVVESITEGAVKHAKEVGAKALFSKQVTAVELGRAIKALVPRINWGTEENLPGQEREIEAVGAQENATSDLQEKVGIAQTLLAKVLHSLKTSDLLSVVDKDDVPRVVLEMTRKVCNIEGTSDNTKSMEQRLSSEDMSSQLEKIFKK